MILRAVKWGFVFGLILSTPILFVFGLNYIIFNYSDEIKTLNYAYMFDNHIKNNNLSPIFPHLNDYEGLFRQDIIKYHLNQSIGDFHDSIMINFNYTQNGYDCKYWANTWLIYLYNNKERLNITSVKVEDLENHVFIIFSTSDFYCVADQQILRCNSLK